MKKILVILLSLLMCFSLISLAGCKENNGNPIIDDGPDYSDDGGIVDESRFDTPETGFTIDGLIDATEQTKYNTLDQKYGVEGQMTVSIFIGDKGLYFHFNVNDPITYKANTAENTADTSPYIMDSDRIELFIDTLSDGGTSPKEDDYQIMATLEGYNQVLIGTGSTFRLDTSYGLDACVSTVKEGSTVTVRDLNAVDIPKSQNNIDSGYTVEFFMSYSNFEFIKRDTYKVSIAQSDVCHVINPSRFNSAGSNTTPSEFRTLSVHGFGTMVAIDNNLKIDAQKDAYYTSANVESDADLYYFQAARYYAQTEARGMTTVEAYVYLGTNGLSVYMHSQGDYLKYYFAEFPYMSDHVEMRFDVNNNKATDPVATGDKWFFIDIMGAAQTAYGIDNDTRVAGAYDLVATTAYTGELVDADNKPFINAGSLDPKTFTFEAFFPWYALGVPEGGTFAFILECGNPDEGGTGIGNVFYPDSNYTIKEHWWTFGNYDYYTEFTRS